MDGIISNYCLILGIIAVTLFVSTGLQTVDIFRKRKEFNEAINQSLKGTKKVMQNEIWELNANTVPYDPAIKIEEQ